MGGVDKRIRQEEGKDSLTDRRLTRSQSRLGASDLTVRSHQIAKSAAARRSGLSGNQTLRTTVDLNYLDSASQNEHRYAESIL